MDDLYNNPPPPKPSAPRTDEDDFIEGLLIMVLLGIVIFLAVYRAMEQANYRAPAPKPPEPTPDNVSDENRWVDRENIPKPAENISYAQAELDRARFANNLTPEPNS